MGGPNDRPNQEPQDRETEKHKQLKEDAGENTRNQDVVKNAWAKANRKDKKHAGDRAQEKDKGARQADGDWIFPPEVVHRSDRRLSAEERAERRRIASTTENRIGFLFGKATKENLRDEVLSLLKKHQNDASLLGGFKIKVDGYASKPGPEEYNKPLSEKRAQNVADIVKSAIQQVEVQFNPSSIEVKGWGETRAQGKEGKDHAEDRVVTIEFVPLAGDQSKIPNASKADRRTKPGVERLHFPDHVAEAERISIPREYARDYKHSREWATNRFRMTLELLKQVVPLGKPTPRKLATKFGIEAGKQVTDAIRYRNEMEQAKDVHEKLWAVRPMHGFIFDKSKTSFRWRIESLLQEGGYDVKKMYPEYVTHWLRKEAI